MIKQKGVCMKRFQVPYNFDINLIEWYNKYENFIESIYFAAPQDVFPSARMLYGKPHSTEEIKMLIENTNIDTYVVMNGTSLVLTDEILYNVKIFLEQVSYKLTGVIVANPFLGEYIHESFPMLKLKMSVLSNEHSYEKLIQINDLNYYDEVCFSNDFISKSDIIKKIKNNTNFKIGIITNSTCRNNCPLYGWHHQFFNSQADNEKMKELNRVFRQLTMKFTQDIKDSSYIKPSEIKQYYDLFDIFKLEDRTLPTEIIKEIVLSYIEENDDNRYLHGSCFY